MNLVSSFAIAISALVYMLYCFIAFFLSQTDLTLERITGLCAFVYLSAALTYIKMDEMSPLPPIVRNDAKISQIHVLPESAES